MATLNTSNDTSARPSKPLRVGDLLLSKEIISHDQLEQALSFQKDRGQRKLLGEVLIELGFVTDQQVMAVLAEAYGVPYVDLHPKLPDRHLDDLLPHEYLEEHGVVPLFLVGGKLTLAMHEPANVFLVEEVERRTGSTVQIVAATAAAIRETLQKNTRGSSDVFVIDDVVDELGEDALSLVEEQITDLSNLEESASESPVIKLVNYLIYAAVEDGASDIHVEPGEKKLRVRYRVDGKLFEKMSPPAKMLPAVVSRIKIMAGLDISERRVPQDGAITIAIQKRQIDLRVSTMPSKIGEKVVMRIIDTSNAVASLDLLGFSAPMLDKIRAAVSEPNGIFLVTGPTGSGKSTSLYAALSEMSDESINVSTVEDPVEYNLGGINQFQTNDKAGFTFAGALRALLRQDPDVIMVGEIRDLETAKIAVQAALTGHMVLSTLHTNDAPSAVTRLFNIGVEPYLVAAALRGVLAQRLVRRICKHCKEPYAVTPADERLLSRISVDTTGVETLYRGAGCTTCRNTGFAGRLGIYEYYEPDDAALDAITAGASLQELRRLARDCGDYATLRQEGFAKVRAGLTTLEELLKATTA